MGPQDRTYFLHCTLEPDRVVWRHGTFSAALGLQTWQLWYDHPWHDQPTAQNIAGLLYTGIVDLAELTT